MGAVNKLSIQKIVGILRLRFMRWGDVLIACRGIAALPEPVSCIHKSSQARCVALFFQNYCILLALPTDRGFVEPFFSGLTAYRS